jgi:DNA-binding TFAR19-related protein (PDSD5 family)
MINDYKFKLEVQNTVENYILQLMNANNISASLMEDALYKVLVSLKERQMQEMLIELESDDTEELPEEETGEEEE